MSKEQIIDEVYNSFCNLVDARWQESDIGDLDDFIYDKLLISGYDEKGEWFARLPTKEQFITTCKTDSEFSQKWGLKIEERELSLLERYELMKKLDNWISVHYKEPKTMEYMNKHNIPTKLITITYNNKTIETYE